MRSRSVDAEIIGFNGYKVFPNGNVTGKRGWKLKWGYNAKGYPIYKLYSNNGQNKKYFLVHRLVAIIFVKNDDPKHKTQVHHVDRNIHNPDAKNLRWVTPKEHQELTIKHRREELKKDCPF